MSRSKSSSDNDPFVNDISKHFSITELRKRYTLIPDDIGKDEDDKKRRQKIREQCVKASGTRFVVDYKKAIKHPRFRWDRDVIAAKNDDDQYVWFCAVDASYDDVQKMPVKEWIETDGRRKTFIRTHLDELNEKNQLGSLMSGTVKLVGGVPIGKRMCYEYFKVLAEELRRKAMNKRVHEKATDSGDGDAAVAVSDDDADAADSGDDDDTSSSSSSEESVVPDEPKVSKKKSSSAPPPQKKKLAAVAASADLSPGRPDFENISCSIQHEKLQETMLQSYAKQPITFMQYAENVAVKVYDNEAFKKHVDTQLQRKFPQKRSAADWADYLKGTADEETCYALSAAIVDTTKKAQERLEKMATDLDAKVLDERKKAEFIRAEYDQMTNDMFQRNQKITELERSLAAVASVGKALEEEFADDDESVTAAPQPPPPPKTAKPKQMNGGSGVAPSPKKSSSLTGAAAAVSSSSSSSSSSLVTRKLTAVADSAPADEPPAKPCFLVRNE